MKTLATNACRLDLTTLMRQHKVTIRELAAKMGITMTRVREVRRLTRVSYPQYCDFTEAVTGQSVWNRGRWEAMQRQQQSVNY